MAYGIPQWMLNRQYDVRSGEYKQIIGTEIDMTLRDDINRLKKIRSKRGIRHNRGLKVRGQRTRTTGRHGVVVGYMKRAGG